MTRKKDYSDLNDVVNNLPDYLSNKSISITGNIILDTIFGGPLEFGSFYEIIGDSGTGKSTILLSTASYLCSVGIKVLFIDTESSISAEQLKDTGVGKYLGTYFIYVSESTFDKVEEIMDSIIATGEVQIIMLDSLATLVNSCFTDKNSKISITTNSSLYGSRPLTLFMNKYKSLAASDKFCLIFSNQWRQRIGNTGSVNKSYGPKNVEYNCDVIIELSKMTSVGLNQDFKSMFSSLDRGFAVNLKLTKSNKRSPGVFPSYFLYGSGLSNRCSIIYALVSKGIIEKNGSYYSYNDSMGTIKSNGIVNFYDDLGSKLSEIYIKHKDTISSYYNEKT